MNTIGALLKQEVLRRINDEFIPKILDCLNSIEEKDIYFRYNENCNSINNLIQHLNGNVRQWILSAACGLPDHRTRSKEFEAENHLPKDDLIQLLRSLKIDLEEHLPNLDENLLMKKRKVQCYNETILSMLIHSTEHFSYHTGQIVYITKSLKNRDMAFYAEDRLEETN